jgi:HEAT repeat protein
MIAEIYGSSPVVAALMDADINVRNQSTMVLKTMGATATPDLISGFKVADTTYQSIISNILIDIGEVAVDQLLATMEDKSFNVRKNLVFIFGEIGDFRAVEPLISSLRDKKIFVRKISAQSLEKITSQTFGTNHDEWLNWLNEQKLKN